MSYAEDHASALLDLTAAGAAVTFTDTLPGTYSEATDSWSSPTVSTVGGYALRVTGDPKVYEALKLVEAEAVTLVFCPTTYGDVPPLNSSATWGGTAGVVRQTSPVAPDGTAILVRVVLGL